VGPTVTPGHANGIHSGCPAGENIPTVITDKNGSGWADPDRLTGMQQWQGVRLGPAQGIATDDHFGTLIKLQLA